MAAFDFPASPTDGQLSTQNGVTFQYSTTRSAWLPYQQGTTGSMIAIQTIVAAGGEATIDFQNIPSTYDHLLLIFAARNAASGTGPQNVRLKMNNDTTAANYSSDQYVYGSSSSMLAGTDAANSDGSVITGIPGTSGNANAMAGGRIWFPGYKLALPKIAVCESFDATSQLEKQARGFAWNSSAVINRLTLTLAGSGAAAGSTFTLVGIGGTAASGTGIASGGSWVLLDSVVTAGGQTTIAFNGISQAYKHLKFEYQVRDSGAGTGAAAKMQINGDATAANYSASQYLYGSGGSSGASTEAASTAGANIMETPQITGNANAIGQGTITLNNYRSTTMRKIVHGVGAQNYGATLQFTNRTFVYVGTPAAVTSVLFTATSAFADGGVVSMYGLADTPPAELSVSGGGASVTVDVTAPASPAEGDLWLDPTYMTLSVYYDSTWVAVSTVTYVDPTYQHGAQLALLAMGY